MLQAVLIVNAGGLNLFSATWLRDLQQPRFVGSAFRTLYSTADALTGLALQEVAMEDGSFYVATLKRADVAAAGSEAQPGTPSGASATQSRDAMSDRVLLFTAVLLERPEHPGEKLLGRHIAQATVRAFYRQFPDEVNNSVIFNLKRHASFHTAIPGVILEAIQAAAEEVADDMPGLVQLAVLHEGAFVIHQHGRQAAEMGVGEVGPASVSGGELCVDWSELESPALVEGVLRGAFEASDAAMALLGDTATQISLKHVLTGGAGAPQAGTGPAEVEVRPSAAPEAGATAPKQGSAKAQAPYSDLKALSQGSRPLLTTCVTRIAPRSFLLVQLDEVVFAGTCGQVAAAPASPQTLKAVSSALQSACVAAGRFVLQMRGEEGFATASAGTALGAIAEVLLAPAAAADAVAAPAGEVFTAGERIPPPAAVPAQELGALAAALPPRNSAAVEGGLQRGPDGADWGASAADAVQSGSEPVM